MDADVNLLVNELYRIIAGIRECRRNNKLELSGNVSKILLKLGNIINNVQQYTNNITDYVYTYEQIEIILDILQSIEWLTSGLWISILISLTNILRRRASCNIIDISLSKLLTIDLISYENKLDGVTSEYLSCIRQILLGESSSNIKANTICQIYTKLFHLSLQNKHSAIRLHSLNTFTRLITRHHIQNYEIPLLLSIIVSLDWLYVIRNESSEKRLHITNINTLELLQINKFDYYKVLKLYSTNISTLVTLSRNIINTTSSIVFVERLSSLILTTLNAINVYLEYTIRTNGVDTITPSLTYVLRNHLSFSLFVSFLWENECIIDAAIRCMFNLYKIFGMNMSKELELLISQLFSNPLNANKEYNSYLLRRIFLTLSAGDIYTHMDAYPYRHNTYHALIKLLLNNSIPEFKVDTTRSVNNISKRKNVFSQNRNKTRDRTARPEDTPTTDTVSTDSLTNTLAAISAVLDCTNCTVHIPNGTKLILNDTIRTIDIFNEGGDWLKHFGDDVKRIVLFLRSPFLDLKRVGEFLGSHTNPIFMDKVRREFVAQFNFTAMPIVTALRLFLSTFRLPGESQQIERIIDSFAEAYYSDQLQQADPIACFCNVDNIGTPTHNEKNLTLYRWVVQEDVYFDTFKNEYFISALRGYHTIPFSNTIDTNTIQNDTNDITNGSILGPYVWRKSFEGDMGAWFANADAVFVLCYSIIMLNTDLHNSQIKNKMKLDEFIRNNKGINAGGDLPEPFLNDIYKSISRSQIQLYKDYAGSIQPDRDSFNTNYASRKMDILQVPVAQYRQYWNSLYDTLSDIESTIINNVQQNLQNVLDNNNVVSIVPIVETSSNIMSSSSSSSSSACLDVLVRTGILDFLDASVYLSTSAEFLQDTLMVLWKLSVIAERIGHTDLINDIFVLPSLTFTDQLSHRCQILIAFTLHYIAAFGRHFDTRSWEIAYSTMLSLLSLNLLQNSVYGIPGPAIPSGSAIIPPKIKFHRVDLKRQGFKWISDIAGYIFSNKHTIDSNMMTDEFSAPRFGREALNSASSHFLFSPQRADTLVITPLFDPLLTPSQIELIKSDEDEISLRHLFDMFYQFGPTNTSSNKASRNIDYSQRPPIAAMINISTLPDTSIPQLLDYYKFRLALINHYKAHMLIPMVLSSSNCKLNQFVKGLNEIENLLSSSTTGTSSTISSTIGNISANTTSTIGTTGSIKSARRYEREEEESERCKRGVILAPNEKEVGRFRIKASPLVALGTLGMIIEFVHNDTTNDATSYCVVEKLVKTIELFTKIIHNLLDNDLIDNIVQDSPIQDSQDGQPIPTDTIPPVPVQSSSVLTLNWLAGDELDAVKVGAVAIILDLIAKLGSSCEDNISKFCDDMLYIVSRLPCKYLSPCWLKPHIHQAALSRAQRIPKEKIQNKDDDNIADNIPDNVVVEEECTEDTKVIEEQEDKVVEQHQEDKVVEECTEDIIVKCPDEHIAEPSQESILHESILHENIVNENIVNESTVHENPVDENIVQNDTIVQSSQENIVSDNIVQNDTISSNDIILTNETVSSTGTLSVLLLLQRLCGGLGELSILHRHDKRSCVVLESHSVWRIFCDIVSNDICDDILCEVVQTVILISIFYQKCPSDGIIGDDCTDQVEAVKMLVNLQEKGLFVRRRGIVPKSLALISSFAPKTVRAAALISLQKYLQAAEITLSDFFSTLNDVIIPLVTYKWTYKDTFAYDDGKDGILPIFHEHLSPLLSPVSDFLSPDIISARMASSFSTLCQTFMAALPLLLEGITMIPDGTIGSNIGELTKCGENCIGYLLLAIRMVLRSLAEPASRCVKHVHGYHLLDSCAEAAGVSDKVTSALPSHRAVLATIANSIADAQDLQDIFITIIQTMYEAVE